MDTYCVVKTSDNNETYIKVFDDRHKAIVYGAGYFAMLSEQEQKNCIVTVEHGKFMQNDNGEIINFSSRVGICWGMNYDKYQRSKIGGVAK